MRGVPLKERLLARSVEAPDGCRVWTGCTDPEGYGRMGTVLTTEVLVHRISYIENVGPIPPGMLVCHKCDNRPCIEPTHFFLGTDQDNVDDRVRKGRSVPPKGERNRHAKLTERKVLRIKARLAAGANQSLVARQYGVDQCSINHIARGRTWRHLPAERTA